MSDPLYFLHDLRWETLTEREKRATDTTEATDKQTTDSSGQRDDGQRSEGQRDDGVKVVCALRIPSIVQKFNFEVDVILRNAYMIFLSGERLKLTKLSFQ